MIFSYWCYLSSTVAPASSSCFLNFSASSLFTPSFNLLGAPSTKSLASFRPSPVIVLTSLITLIFLSPALARWISNSVFSSPAGSAVAPPAVAATATGAAAETPHFSSRIFVSYEASRTVSVDKSSAIFWISAIFYSLFLIFKFIFNNSNNVRLVGC